MFEYERRKLDIYTPQNGSKEFKLYLLFTLVFALIGMVASILTVVLVHRMNRKQKPSGHVVLVLMLSYYQMIFDFLLIIRPLNGRALFVSSQVIGVVFGWGSSVISLLIAFCAFYIVFFRRRIDVHKNFYTILWGSLMPGLINSSCILVGAIPSTTGSHQIPTSWWYFSFWVYWFGRLIFIVISFIICAALIYKVELMRPINGQLTPQQIAIRTVSRRMIFYPIVQAIGRSGYTWMEGAYGFSAFPHYPDKTHFACYIYVAIITPFASVGYLIIFLLMQPNAYKNFKQMLGCNNESDNNTAATEKEAQLSISKIANVSLVSREFENRASSEDTTESAKQLLQSFVEAHDDELFSFASSAEGIPSITSPNASESNKTYGLSNIIRLSNNVGSNGNSDQIRNSRSSLTKILLQESSILGSENPMVNSEFQYQM